MLGDPRGVRERSDGVTEFRGHFGSSRVLVP